MPKRTSARDKLRDFFRAHVGETVDMEQLQEAAGISEWARRVRELREQEGMQISSHLDRTDLKPGQYILESLESAPSSGETIPRRIAFEVMERDGYTCQICGAGAGDKDPFAPNRRIRLHVDHIKPKTHGGPIELDNLRTLCHNCNQNKRNTEAASETALSLLGRIRRAPVSTQREIFEKLKDKFEPTDKS